MQIAVIAPIIVPGIIPMHIPTAPTKIMPTETAEIELSLKFPREKPVIITAAMKIIVNRMLSTKPVIAPPITGLTQKPIEMA